MSCSVCQGYDSHHCPCCGDGIDTIECPDCHGTGREPWRAINLDTLEIVEVTHNAWILLPEDEDDATLMTLRGKKQNFCRYSEGGGKCMTCYGDGKIIG